jgi:vacuolar-type H+-ATPase subunit I/STV1
LKESIQIRLAVLFIVCFWSVIAFLSNFQALLKLMAVCILAGLVMMAISVSSKHLNDEARRDIRLAGYPRLLWIFFVFGSMAGLFLAAAIGTFSAVLVLLQHIIQAYILSSAPIAVALSSLAIGAVLFAVRYKFRCVYGFTEAIAGVIVAAYQTRTALPIPGLDALPAPTANPGYYLAVLTAGVYLIVRGFDNIHQGYTKDPKDPVAIALSKVVKAAAQRWVTYTSDGNSKQESPPSKTKA